MRYSCHYCIKRVISRKKYFNINRLLLIVILYHYLNRKKGTTQSALYYINGMEAAVASIEVSAIGAKSVAKLVSKRLGLIQVNLQKVNEIKEEL